MSNILPDEGAELLDSSFEVIEGRGNKYLRHGVFSQKKVTGNASRRVAWRSTVGAEGVGELWNRHPDAFYVRRFRGHAARF